VGALTSRQYRFRSRPWDLRSTNGVAVDDPVGSNVFVDSRDGRVLRLRPRENLALNDAWIGDRTRFETVPADRAERLGTPLIRRDGKLVPSTWFEAVRKAGGLMRNHKVGFLLSPALTNEALAVAKEAALGALQVWPKLSAWPVQGTLENLGKSKAVLVVGCDPWTELPMLALRIRKAVVGATDQGITRGGGAALVVVGADNGLFRDTRAWLKCGGGVDDVVKALEDLVLGLDGGGSEAAQKAGALLKAAPVSIVAGPAVAAHDRGRALLDRLSQALGVSNDASLYGAVDGYANARGARDLLGDEAVGADLFSGATGGSDVVVVMGDVPHHQGFPLTSAKGAIWLTAQLGKDAALLGPEQAGGVPAGVDVVLPLAHAYEQAGSFTNLEGRVQGFDAGGIPPGTTERAKADYEALALLASEMGAAMPKDLKGLRAVLSARYAVFKNLQNRASLRSELTVV
jgi:NADH-quinone oxidoreductase subunit G